MTTLIKLAERRKERGKEREAKEEMEETVTKWEKEKRQKGTEG